MDDSCDKNSPLSIYLAILAILTQKKSSQWYWHTYRNSTESTRFYIEQFDFNERIFLGALPTYMIVWSIETYSFFDSDFLFFSHSSNFKLISVASVLYSVLYFSSSVWAPSNLRTEKFLQVISHSFGKSILDKEKVS